MPLPRLDLRRTTVALCGSTTQLALIAADAAAEMEDGKIVLYAVYPLPGGDGPLDPARDGEVLDVQLDTVAMADEVLILNVNGWIGAALQQILTFAREYHKDVRFLSPELPDPRTPTPSPGVQRLLRAVMKKQQKG